MSCHGAEKVEMLIVFCTKQLILSNLFYSFSAQINRFQVLVLETVESSYRPEVWLYIICQRGLIIYGLHFFIHFKEASVIVSHADSCAEMKSINNIKLDRFHNLKVTAWIWKLFSGMHQYL